MIIASRVHFTFFLGKYDGLAPQEKQYSPLASGSVNIASRGEQNHRIDREKCKIIVLLNFLKLVFDEHIRRIEIFRGHHYGLYSQGRDIQNVSSR